MTQDLETHLHWAHLSNIERYRKILRTHLTAGERAFVERRLAEEEAALKQLADRGVRRKSIKQPTQLE